MPSPTPTIPDPIATGGDGDPSLGAASTGPNEIARDLDTAPVKDRGAAQTPSATLPPDVRRREAMEAVRKRFHCAGDHYYYKDQARRVAFTDRGLRLTTQAKDLSTAHAMAMLAEAKGWSAIKVTGDEAFRRQVWLEATLRGMRVRGFQPRPIDLVVLDNERRQRSQNAIGPMTRSAATQAPSSRSQSGLGDGPRRTSDREGPGPPTRPPSDQRRVIEAVAAALVTAKATDPVIRQRLMQAVSQHLDLLNAKGKELPHVHTYDRNAPAMVIGPDQVRPQVARHSERTR